MLWPSSRAWLNNLGCITAPATLNSATPTILSTPVSLQRHRILGRGSSSARGFFQSWAVPPIAELIQLIVSVTTRISEKGLATIDYLIREDALTIYLQYFFCRANNLLPALKQFGTERFHPGHTGCYFGSSPNDSLSFSTHIVCPSPARARNPHQQGVLQSLELMRHDRPPTDGMRNLVN